MSSTISDRPNIIFILVDQMRGDAFGADGNGYIETPNIDALAAKGTRFCHAYTACPSCIPARATLMSGQTRWHPRHGVWAESHPQLRRRKPLEFSGNLTNRTSKFPCFQPPDFNTNPSIRSEFDLFDDAHRPVNARSVMSVSVTNIAT